MDMFTHLSAWVRRLKAMLGGHWDDEEKDHIFLNIGLNGVPQPHSQISMKKIQGLINEFASGAGVRKDFTTHSFRRGGAQYRFMHAPLGRRWSLSIVRWWGGWAEGENVCHDVYLSRQILINFLIFVLFSFSVGIVLTDLG
jgi:hypothetical protein